MAGRRLIWRGLDFPSPAMIGCEKGKMSRHRSSLAVVAPIGLLMVLLLGWIMTTAFSGVPRHVLPGLDDVARRLWSGLVVQADTWSFAGVSLTEALAGSAVGLAVALPLAVVIFHFRLASAAVTPFLGASQAIPAVALAPILALWMASGFWRVVALCALVVFFPILISSVVGLRHIDHDILAAAQVDGANGWAKLTHIELPLALPQILAGIRNGFTLSITGSFVGEMVMGGQGLGSLLMIQWYSFDTAGMFATIVLLAALAAIIHGLVLLAERAWADTLIEEKR